MNISVDWLRALAPSITATAAELAAELSARAVPVDRTEILGAELGQVVVARVLRVRSHPDADRLSLCTVDAGGGEELEVVCGAPEVVEGALYPFIPAGGTLPGGFRIEKRKIRGATSHGMLCSEKELGLGRDAAGIMRLGDKHLPGEALQGALGLPDARLDIDLTPNRIDLACHVGVARELAPGGVDDVRLPDFGGAVWEPAWESGAEEASAGGTRVILEDSERCFRYLAAAIRGVTVGPSPEWLQNRLRAVGARPINNVVDATNYVLLELNQPLHAFDLPRLRGAEIRVRAARGETLTTLDGGEHELDDRVTVIADAERPVALAGVMGGSDSEVSAGTTELLIECAAFDPRSTRRTARATGLATDASYRFERGIDESGLETALRRCVELILAVAGGEADATAIRVGRSPAEPTRIRLRPSRVRRVLGLRLSGEQIGDLLRPLGFGLESDSTEGEAGAGLEVTVPGWRVDVCREVDLLEEVARRYGYDSFPHEARAIRPSVVPDSPALRRADRVRHELTASGCLEVRSPSFAPADRVSGQPVRLLKPLSEAEALLRTDLVPTLLGRLEHNWSRGHRDVRLFEIGTVFARAPAVGDAKNPTGAFAEEGRVGLVLSGRREPAHWSLPRSDLEIWDLKGLIERLARALDLGQVRPGEPPEADGMPALGAASWLGGDALCIFEGDDLVGVAGQVSPEETDAPVWAAPVLAAEIRLAAVSLGEARSYRPLSAFPAVARDLAVVVDEAVPAAAVADAMREAAPETLVSLTPFDVYGGEGVGAGRRSLAWRLVFRAVDRTLTDAEVEEGLGSITANLEARFDARIRSA